MVVFKALYGLRTSGLRWHERLMDTLRDMGFWPSKAEDDIWMRRNGDICECIGVCTDDLALAVKDPKGVADELINKHKFKLKGTGEIAFHLGCDFCRDDEGVLCFAPKKHTDKMIDSCQRMFGQMPKTHTSPLESNDHPETDQSDLLDEEGTRKC